MRMAMAMLLTVTVVAASRGHAAEPSPAELLGQVAAKYQSMQSYQASGEVLSEIDMSAARPEAPAEQPPPTQKLKHTFTVLLGRPGLYRIDWQQEMRPEFVQQGTAWSAGDGAAALRQQNQEPTPEKIAQMKQQIKFAQEMSRNAKGSITETHRDITIDGALAKEQFEVK